MRHLGNMPVTILTSTTSASTKGSKWWPYSQKRLAETVSDNVEWIQVDAHHTMHHDRPDLVADAVKKTLERVAKKNGRPIAK